MQRVYWYATQKRSITKISIQLFRQRLSHKSASRAAEEKQTGFCRYIATNKVTLWSASYSARVVYTKTFIHLSVAGSLEIKVVDIYLHFGE